MCQVCSCVALRRLALLCCFQRCFSFALQFRKSSVLQSVTCARFRAALLRVVSCVFVLLTVSCSLPCLLDLLCFALLLRGLLCFALPYVAFDLPCQVVLTVTCARFARALRYFA